MSRSDIASGEKKPIVSDIKVDDISPKINIREIAELLPKTLHPQRIEFTISNVSNAISNGIRRTVACELLVKGLDVEYENIKTNDLDIIPEMLIKRFRLMPIKQNVPIGATFELIAENHTGRARWVMSSEVVVKGASGAYFNETFPLFELKANKWIKITNIFVHQNYGFVENYGGYVVAIHATSLALDVTPINLYERVGTPSSIANPRVWRVGFDTHGTMPAERIVVAACDNIIARMNNIRDLLYSINNNDDQYILVIEGESHTIGNIIMKSICELYPAITSVKYNVPSIGRTLTVTITCDEDINAVYNTVIEYVVGIYNNIKKAFD